jgi:ribosomal subunit interface protein
VQDKLARLEKHDQKVIRIEVEVEKERNPRQHDRSVKVELTAFTKGPVMRAEAAADDKMAALDLALDKMSAQMRRAADRKRVHRGRHAPVSVAQATAALVNGTATLDDDLQRSAEDSAGVTGEGPMVVREKSHAATPMNLDQALYEMELVGHDFYLFVEESTRRPSVVYRRRGYDYGVISLELESPA